MPQCDIIEWDELLDSSNIEPDDWVISHPPPSLCLGMSLSIPTLWVAHTVLVVAVDVAGDSDPRTVLRVRRVSELRSGSCDHQKPRKDRDQSGSASDTLTCLSLCAPVYRYTLLAVTMALLAVTMALLAVTIALLAVTMHSWL